MGIGSNGLCVAAGRAEGTRRNAPERLGGSQRGDQKARMDGGRSQRAEESRDMGREPMRGGGGGRGRMVVSGDEGVWREEEWKDF